MTHGVWIRLSRGWKRGASALTVWAVAWAVMRALDGTLDVANLALVLVLAAALAGLWLSLTASAVACLVAVAAFNWTFVPPRGTFRVELQQDAWRLGAMLLVAGIVSALVARQRALAVSEQRAAARAEQLRSMGEVLRDSEDPLGQGPALQQALIAVSGAMVQLLVLREKLPPLDDAHCAVWLGEPDADATRGLWLCTRLASALGPGTGRHEDEPCVYLPLRARGAAFGAACLAGTIDREARAQAQALCDQWGLALERAQALRAAARDREQAQAQHLRNALLAAIAHDHRTPLATIIGAASSLSEQDARMSPEQRRRLAGTIVDEAGRLARLTDNTLQLARLDAPGVQLSLDWESAEELVGSAVARVRRFHGARRVHTRVEPGLPLLRCDAVLIVQMLVNLLDNALKHGAPDAPIELLVQRVMPDRLMLAVRDRGPGVPPADRERIFDVFQRGGGAQPSGAGIGLALCRAVARVHGGTLSVRTRNHGGASFECLLPLAEAAAPAFDQDAMKGAA